jgi:hypothetical protein
VINVREFCFTPMNGHHPAAVACRFCTRSGVGLAKMREARPVSG